MTSVEILRALVAMIEKNPDYTSWEESSYKKYFSYIADFLAELDEIRVEENYLDIIKQNCIDFLNQLSLTQQITVYSLLDSYDAYLCKNNLFGYTSLFESGFEPKSREAKFVRNLTQIISELPLIIKNNLCDVDFANLNKVIPIQISEIMQNENQNKLLMALLQQHRHPYQKNVPYQVTLDGKNYNIIMDKSATLRRSKWKNHINLYIHNENPGNGVNPRIIDIEKILLKIENHHKKIYTTIQHKKELKNPKIIKKSNLTDDGKLLKKVTARELQASKLTGLSNKRDNFVIYRDKNDNSQSYFVEYKVPAIDLSFLILPKITRKPDDDDLYLNKEVLYLTYNEDENILSCHINNEIYTLGEADLPNAFELIKQTIQTNDNLDDLAQDIKQTILQSLSKKLPNPLLIDSQDKVQASLAVIHSYFANVKNHRMIHGNINPTNIIYNSKNGIARIINFDEWIEIQETPKTRFVGTRPFIPPEGLTEDIKTNFGYDVYSLGITLIQILFGKDEKYLDLDNIEQFSNELPEDLRPLLSIAKRMCHHDALQKPPVEDVYIEISKCFPLDLKNFFSSIKLSVSGKKSRKDIQITGLQLAGMFHSFSLYLSKLKEQQGNVVTPLEQKQELLVALIKEEMSFASDTDFIDFLESLKEASSILRKTNRDTEFSNLIDSLCSACVQSIKNPIINNANEKSFFADNGICKDKAIDKKLLFYRQHDENSKLEFGLDEKISSLNQARKEYKYHLLKKSYNQEVLSSKLDVAEKLQKAITAPCDVTLSSQERIAAKQTKISNYQTIINDKKNIEILSSHRCGLGKSLLKKVASILAAPLVIPIWFVSHDTAYNLLDKILESKGRNLIEQSKKTISKCTAILFAAPSPSSAPAASPRTSTIENKLTIN